MPPIVQFDPGPAVLCTGSVIKKDDINQQKKLENETGSVIRSGSMQHKMQDLTETKERRLLRKF